VTTSADQTLRIWDGLTGMSVTAPLFHSGSVLGAAFSPNGRAVVSWGLAPFAIVWDAETGERLRAPLNHAAAIQWAEFSPDGRFIVTASTDKSARLWDASNGEAISVPLQHAGPVSRVRLHPDGRQILTASDDGGIRIWEFDETNWPREEVTQLTAVLNSHEIDHTLSRASLPANRVISMFRELQSKHPDGFASMPERRLSWHHHRAKEALLAGRWSASIHHHTELIEDSPDTAALYGARGDARAELGQWALAGEDFAKRIELDPNQSPGEMVLACLKAGNLTAAREWAGRLVDWADASEDWGRKNGSALYVACGPNLLSDYSRILEWAEQHPDPSWSIELRIVQYHRTGRYEDVIGLFEQHDLQTRAWPYFKYFYAMALFQMGRAENGIENLIAANDKLDFFRQPSSFLERPRWWHLAQGELLRDEADALMRGE
jgi:tetratricopeptide (TPR) repeat protein